MWPEAPDGAAVKVVKLNENGSTLVLTTKHGLTPDQAVAEVERTGQLYDPIFPNGAHVIDEDVRYLFLDPLRADSGRTVRFKRLPPQTPYQAVPGL